MTHRDEHVAGDQNLEAPEKLRDDLAGLYGAPLSVPPELDEAVLALAREKLQLRQPHWRLRRWLAASAAAAAVLLAVLMVQSSRRPPPGPTEFVQTACDPDVDASGRVDVLDAFVLARYVETSRTLKGEWDINRDGLVDGADVTTIAALAVRLDGGTF